MLLEKMVQTSQCVSKSSEYESKLITDVIDQENFKGLGSKTWKLLGELRNRSFFLECQAISSEKEKG